MKIRMSITHITGLICSIILLFSGCSTRRKNMDIVQPERLQDTTIRTVEPTRTGEGPTASPRRDKEATAFVTVQTKEQQERQKKQDAPAAAVSKHKAARPISAADMSDAQPHVSAVQDTRATTTQTIIDDMLVKVQFEDEDLITMINHFAALQHRNIIVPQGADAITQRVTFKLPYDIPLKDVDRYLDTFLELAGYSRVPHGSFYRIVRNDPLVTHEALPLYVAIPPAQLPNSEDRIRVIMYLTNLRVPDNTQGTDPITIILNDMLTSSRSYLFDSKSNAVIVADKANTLKAALTVLAELDSMGTKDVIRAIPLFNSSADTVAALLTTQIFAANADDQLSPGPKSDSGRYFASGLRVAPDPRTNSLIVMGKEPAVERLQDFLRESIDVPTESGASILHYYDLQYLDAEKFGQVLQKIIQEQFGSGQATHDASGGPQHFFDGPRVVAEKVIAEKVEEKKLTTGIKESVLKGSVYRGGNRLIITATKRDWKRIKQLIADLDKPRLQAIVQVMILDFDVNSNKILGAQTRNPEWMQLPKGFAFQSAQLVPPILDGPITPDSNPPIYTDPTTVAADLLRLLSGGVSAATILSNQTDNIGSTIFSFNDNSSQTPGTWAFIQWLSRFGETNVISNPYVVVLNHSRGEEELTQIRRLPGPAETGEGGAISRKVEDVPASLKVSVVPRASSIDRINLQVSIVIEQFQGVSTGNRVTRELHTNVNLGNGETLVLGGLSRCQETEIDTETPIIGRIPILRWLFANSEKNMRKTNLVVLVSPTIIEPKIRVGMNTFTYDRAHHGNDLMSSGGLLSQLKDPVSYLFFEEERNDLKQMLDEYLAISKGDFVFHQDMPNNALSNHHCAPCTDTIVTDTPEAAELKRVLAAEENPLLAVHQAPQERILNR